MKVCRCAGDLILCGHDHAPSICRSGRARSIARACILTIEKGAADVQPLEVRYPVQKALDRFDELRCPDAENIQKFFYGVG